MEAHRAKTRQRRGLVHDSRARRVPLDLGSLELLQETFKRLMLPSAEQCYRICAKTISRVKRPAPPIRANAFLAVVERATVVVDRYPPTLDAHHEMARMNLTPRRLAYLGHRPPLEGDLSQYLAYLSRRDFTLSAFAHTTYLG